MDEKIYVKEIIRLFKIEIINNKTADINRTIMSPAIHGKGLQLLGMTKNKRRENIKTIIGWGTDVNEYLSSLSEEEARKAISNVLTNTTPLILLSIGITKKIEKIIVEESNKYNIPVSSTKLPLTVLITTIGSYLVSVFAEHDDVHASLVVINGMGVMIIGKSGVGKSEAVLGLIGNGHSFVSDDTVHLKKIGHKFIGEPVKITNGLLEARGIGIINIAVIYGAKTIKKTTDVELVIELIEASESVAPDRLGTANHVYKVLGGSIPLIKIPVHVGRSIAVLIEAAVNVHIARLDGADPLKLMEMRNE